MPVYYFDIQIGEAPRSTDEEGEFHPNLDSARLEASRALGSLAGDGTLGELVRAVSVWVRDEAGEVMVGRLELKITRLN